MRQLLMCAGAVVLMAAGWTARGWAQPDPLFFQVTVDERTGAIHAPCGPGCATRYGRSGEVNGLVYACTRQPCSVMISGSEQFVLDRRLR